MSFGRSNVMWVCDRCFRVMFLDLIDTEHSGYVRTGSRIPHRYKGRRPFSELHTDNPASLTVTSVY